jgi:hypothetical protein
MMQQPGGVVMPLSPDNETNHIVVDPSYLMSHGSTIREMSVPDFRAVDGNNAGAIIVDEVEGQSMPNETTPEEPSVVKRAVESTPENPESVLLSAKLTRNASGLTLMLRSPILENFFKVMSNGTTYHAGSVKRWKITQPSLLNPSDSLSLPRWIYPVSPSLLWLQDGVSVNLQILTTVGLGSGVNLNSEVPMTRDAMQTFLENLKGAAKEIYLSFCTPVEGEINLSVTEKLSTGSREVQDL